MLCVLTARVTLVRPSSLISFLLSHVVHLPRHMCNCVNMSDIPQMFAIVEYNTIMTHNFHKVVGAVKDCHPLIFKFLHFQSLLRSTLLSPPSGEDEGEGGFDPQAQHQLFHQPPAHLQLPGAAVCGCGRHGN